MLLLIFNFNWSFDVVTSSNFGNWEIQSESWWKIIPAGLLAPCMVSLCIRHYPKTECRRLLWENGTSIVHFGNSITTRCLTCLNGSHCKCLPTEDCGSNKILVVRALSWLFESLCHLPSACNLFPGCSAGMKWSRTAAVTDLNPGSGLLCGTRSVDSLFECQVTSSDSQKDDSRGSIELQNYGPVMFIALSRIINSFLNCREGKGNVFVGKKY